jgi:hypothetical protein
MMREVAWPLVTSLIVLAFVTSPTRSDAASQLQQICLYRCQLNNHLCEARTPEGGGQDAWASADLSCTEQCIDTYQQSQTTADSLKKLIDCTKGCTPGKQCTQSYVDCRHKCNQMPACSLDAHCGAGQVCETDGPKPQCVSPCTSNNQCKQRLGPDAICFNRHCRKT